MRSDNEIQPFLYSGSHLFYFIIGAVSKTLTPKPFVLCLCNNDGSAEEIMHNSRSHTLTYTHIYSEKVPGLRPIFLVKSGAEIFREQNIYKCYIKDIHFAVLRVAHGLPTTALATESSKLADQ